MDGLNGRCCPAAGLRSAVATGSSPPADSPPPERRPQLAEGPAPGLLGGDRSRSASPQLRGRHPTQQLEAAADKSRGSAALAERPPWDRGNRPGGTPAAQSPRSAQHSPAREAAMRPQQASPKSWRSPRQSPSRDTVDRLQQASADLGRSAQPSPAWGAQHQAPAASWQSAQQSPAWDGARRPQQAALQRGSQLPLAMPARPSEQPVGWDASLTSGGRPQSPLSGQASLARPVRELAAPQLGPALPGAAQLVQPGAGRWRAAEGRAGLEARATLQPGLQEGSGAAAAQPLAGLLAGFEDTPPGQGGQLRGMQQQSLVGSLPQPLQQGAERFRQPESVAWKGEADARSGRRPAQGEAAPRPSRIVSVLMGASHSTINNKFGQALTCPRCGRKQQDGQHGVIDRWHPAGQSTTTTNVSRVAGRLLSSTIRQALHISVWAAVACRSCVTGCRSAAAAQSQHRDKQQLWRQRQAGRARPPGLHRVWRSAQQTCQRQRSSAAGAPHPVCSSPRWAGECWGC